MKTLIWIVIIIIILAGGWVLLNSGAPSDVEQSTINETSTSTDASSVSNKMGIPAGAEVKVDSFSFTGYAPGKIEEGTFSSYRVENLKIESGNIVGGKFVIDTESVSVASDRLKTHLCSEDFFECKTYPEIVFDVKNLKKASENTYTVTGDLTFHGITKEISFTVLKDGNTYSADFRLDTTPFKFKYIAIDKDVRVQFSGTVME